MKTFGTFTSVALFGLLVAAPTSAQQPGPAVDPHHPDPKSETTPAAPLAPASGMKSAGMPMMEMCHQMMADMASMPMRSGAGPSDPKERADMLQMRGEMMKAMGDIMMKHAQRMQGMKGK